jgi:hypothetical protein
MQVDDARSKYAEIRAIVKSAQKDITEENLLKDERVHAALTELNQKEAQLYDQDTQRQIAALREQQAAITARDNTAASAATVLRTCLQTVIARA